MFSCLAQRVPLRVGLVALSVGLAGCTAPAVAPKPFSAQESGTHIADWDRVGQRIAEALQQAGYIPPPPVAGASPESRPVAPVPLYIHVAADGSAFLNGVRQSVENQILRRGGLVNRSAVRSVVVNLDVDVVDWAPRQPRSGGLGTLAGAATGLGIVLGDAAAITAQEGALLALGVGAATDVIRAVTPDFGAEAAWRATIYDGDRLAFHLREPMYLHAGDIPLYRGGGRLAHISSGGSQLVLTPVPVRYAR